MKAPFNIINDIFNASVRGDISEIRRYFSADAEIVFPDVIFDADDFSQLMADYGNRSYGIDALTVEDEEEDTFRSEFSACVYPTDEKNKTLVRHYRVFLLWKIAEEHCLIQRAVIQNKE